MTQAAKLKGIDVGTMPVGRFPIPEGVALPKISFGNGALARRNKRKTYFVPVLDQYGLQCFVERLCHHFGLPGMAVVRPDERLRSNEPNHLFT